MLENKQSYLKFLCGKLIQDESEEDGFAGYVEFSIHPTKLDFCKYEVHRLSYVSEEYKDDFGTFVLYCIPTEKKE